MILVNTLDSTLSDNPVPTEYCIVNVVLAGACPYALVYKKLDGSISISISFLTDNNPFPTFFGFGINSASWSSETPLPN